MLKMSTVINNIVNFNLRNSEYNSSLVINIQYSFSECFEEKVDDEKVKDLELQFPNIEINNEGVEVSIHASFLFINRQGYYSCFYNITDYMPQCYKTSEWIFSTNHDTCWRDSAFQEANRNIFAIKNDISNISKLQKLESVYIPKHVIPNFSNILTNKIQLNEIKTDESSKHKTHLLTTTSKGSSLISTFDSNF